MKEGEIAVKTNFLLPHIDEDEGLASSGECTMTGIDRLINCNLLIIAV
jgi:hypothetical protein